MNPLLVQTPGREVIVEGDLTADNADEFARGLLALNPDAHGEIRLDLRGVDLEDGAALAITVNALRQLCNRTIRVILIHAPQMLAHNLYRIGLLESGRLELVDMREDEPAAF